jgi:hypothetical protein
VFAEVASCDRASDTSVARPRPSAALSGDCRIARSSRDRRLTASVKNRDASGRSEVPSFGRTLGATERFVDPVSSLATRSLRERPRRGPANSTSCRLGRSGERIFRCDVRDVHPRPSPRPPPVRPVPLYERWEEPMASLGHDCTTDLCNACSTRGHAREPGILLRARLPPPSAFAPVTVSRRRELPNRVPLARRVSGSASPRSPAHVSFGAVDEFCPRLVEGSEHDP